MYFYTTLTNVAFMIIYLLIGFILCKTKKADASHGKSLSALLIYLCGPAMILNAFLNVTYRKENLLQMGLFFIISFLLQAIIILILYLIFHKKFNNSLYRLLTIGAAFGNVGYFGLPIINSLFPKNPIVSCYSSVYVMSMNLLAFTLGVFMLTKNKKYISLKSAIINPTTLAISFSLPIYILSINLPSALDNAISILGKMTTPLCMFVLGMRMSTVKVIELFKRPVVYIACFLKLIIFPLFAYLCVFFLPFLNYPFKASILVLSSVPSAAIILSLAELHQTEQEISANIVLLSTILCIITIPLLLLIL